MRSLSTFAAVIGAIIGLAASQSIDPTSVPIGTREQWCQAQTTSCPLLCTQTAGNSAATTSNTCDASTLAFSCVCGNGITPNASQYSQTVPYFLCTENNNDCVNNCNGDSTCQTACRTNNPCGAQNPTRVNTSTISTMSATGTGGSAASTGSDGQVFTGFGSGASATASSGSGSSGSSKSAAPAVLLNVGQVYGLGLVAASFLAGFTMLL